MDSTGIPSSGNWVCKPSTGREGANVAVFTDGHLAENSEHFVEEYAKGINVIQMRADLPNFDGAYPIIGSWMIGDASVGIGIREGKFITTDGSHFVPHYFI
jgi:glutathionylspermidine synthase